MRAIMAVSRNGYFTVREHDDMRWTGGQDKAIFKRYTTKRGGVCLAGKATIALIPNQMLPDRRLIRLSRRWRPLIETSIEFPNSCLLGGPTLILEALEQNLLTEILLCRVMKDIEPEAGAVSADSVYSILHSDKVDMAKPIELGGVTLLKFRPKIVRLPIKFPVYSLTVVV